MPKETVVMNDNPTVSDKVIDNNEEISVTNETNESNNTEARNSEDANLIVETGEGSVEKNNVTAVTTIVEEDVESVNPINNTINPDSSNVNTYPVKKIEQKSVSKFNNNENVKKDSSNTFKVMFGNNEVFNVNFLTLEILNRIFNENFTNGMLLFYIDGKLVFNDTVTDDLSVIIFKILEDYMGNHEIKAVFTDDNGNTNNYVDNIYIS